MAETQRSVAAIITRLADNATGNISPEDVRDFLVTALGVYGGMSVLDGATAQTSLGTTPVKLTAFDNDLPSSGVTPDSTTDKDLTVSIPGDYLVHTHLSFSGSNSATVAVRVRVNDVEGDLGLTRKIGTGGDVGDCGFTGIITLAASDVVTLYVETDDGGGSDQITVVDGQITLQMIG